MVGRYTRTFGWRSGLAGATLVMALAGVTLVGGPALATSGDELDVVVLDVSGPLLVLYSDYEGLAVAPRRDVSIAIGDDLVPVDSDTFSDEVQTGDIFEGSMSVPADALVDADADVLDEIESLDGESIPAESPVGEAVVELVVESLTALEVVSGDLDTAEAATATSPKAHTLRVAIVSPVGAANTFTSTNADDLATFAEQYWGAQSQQAITEMNGPIIAYSSTRTCSGTPYQFWAEALSQFGIAQSPEQFVAGQNGDHVVVLLPAACSSAQPLGVANVGDSPHDNGVVQVVLGQTVNRSALVHELGHNMGLGHANVDVCDADSVWGCPEYEYADVYDPMGASLTGHDVPPDLSIEAAYELGFLTDAEVPLIDMSPGVFSETQSVHLDRVGLDPSGATIGYRVLDPVTGEIWFIEYRAAVVMTSPPYWMDPGNGILLDGGLVLGMGPGVRALSTGDDGATSAVSYEDEEGYWRAAWDVGESFTTPTGSIRFSFVSGGPSAGATVDIEFLLDENAPNATPVYRFWSETKRTHFFTISSSERDLVIANYDDREWKYEGESYLAFDEPMDGTVPLYRFWSQRYQGHFYTASLSERNAVIANYPDDEWLYEGAAYHVYPDGTDVPNTLGVARFWSTQFRHHFYTANPDERDVVIALYPDDVWRYEATAFDVPASVP